MVGTSTPALRVIPARTASADRLRDATLILWTPRTQDEFSVLGRELSVQAVPYLTHN
jgi:hypothetical protein